MIFFELNCTQSLKEAQNRIWKIWLLFLQGLRFSTNISVTVFSMILCFFCYFQKDYRSTVVLSGFKTCRLIFLEGTRRFRVMIGWVQRIAVIGVQYKSYFNIIQMEDLQESSEERVNFEVREVVWAKITGYPWWPAKITAKPHHQQTHYRVDFLGDNSHAFVGQSKIEKYEQRRAATDIHKHLPKGLRKAINAADLAIRQLGTVVYSTRPTGMQVEVCGRNQKQLFHCVLIDQTLLQQKLEELPNQQNQYQHPQSIPQLNQYGEKQMSHIQLYSKEQRQKYVNSLLSKPKQLTLAEQFVEHKQPSLICKQRSSTNRKANFQRQKKKTAKQTKEIPLGYMLTRKINQLLFKKSGLEQAQRRTISLILSKQVLGQSGTPDDLVRLFKWISISSCDTICNFYANWTCLQSQKQKSSSMTVQEL